MSTVLHTDQLERKIEIQFPLKRIISTVPSQTELLYHLGLRNEVIGITKFCIHPEQWFRQKTRVGGTKQLDLNKIRELKPDLILANKEENDEEQIRALCEEFPVWISDIQTIDEALDMIHSVGQMTGTIEESLKLREEITFARKRHTPFIDKSAAYFIWNDPMMSINRDTFIHEMMNEVGLINVFGDRADSRYPVISAENLHALNPEIVLLSSEPFPFEEKHIKLFQQILPDAEVVLVDGEMFSWYGSRMINAFDYFRTILKIEAKKNLR